MMTETHDSTNSSISPWTSITEAQTPTFAATPDRSGEGTIRDADEAQTLDGPLTEAELVEAQCAKARMADTTLSKAEAADIAALLRLARGGRIPGVKLGRKVRFRVADLDAWIAANTVEAVER